MMCRMSGKIPTIEDIDQLHHVLAPSDAAYDLIHTHCLIVADITRRLIHRQNSLFTRRCTLPDTAAERNGDYEHNETTMMPTDGVRGGAVPPHYLDAHIAAIGALLHDIGVYKLLTSDGSDGTPLVFDSARYIEHGLIGYNILLDEGYDESVAQFARNHTGVGLTRSQVIEEHLPIPPDDYVPMNLEQEVVMVADKYHSKSVPPKFITPATYAKRAARYGKANEERWQELVRKYGTPDVAELAQEYHMHMI